MEQRIILHNEIVKPGYLDYVEIGAFVEFDDFMVFEIYKIVNNLRTNTLDIYIR